MVRTVDISSARAIVAEFTKLHDELQLVYQPQLKKIHKIPSQKVRQEQAKQLVTNIETNVLKTAKALTMELKRKNNVAETLRKKAQRVRETLYDNIVEVIDELALASEMPDHGACLSGGHTLVEPCARPHSHSASDIQSRMKIENIVNQTETAPRPPQAGANQGRRRAASRSAAITEEHAGVVSQPGTPHYYQIHAPYTSGKDRHCHSGSSSTTAVAPNPHHDWICGHNAPTGRSPYTNDRQQNPYEAHFPVSSSTSLHSPYILPPAPPNQQGSSCYIYIPHNTLPTITSLHCTELHQHLHNRSLPRACDLSSATCIGSTNLSALSRSTLAERSKSEEHIFALQACLTDNEVLNNTSAWEAEAIAQKRYIQRGQENQLTRRGNW